MVRLQRRSARRRDGLRIARGAVIACVIGALSMPLACGERDPVPDPDRPPNIVLVLIDTLRRDHVGAYGYPRDTTPFIDARAANGMVFERAIAQAPWTGASMASLWTSRLPPESGGSVSPDAQGIQFLGNTPQTGLDPRWTTLAEALAGAGYSTHAVVANRYAGSRFGMLRGFDERFEGIRSMDVLVDIAIEQLEDEIEARAPAPFFLYVHAIDLHEPITPPAPFDTLFPTEDGKPHEFEHGTWRHGRDIDPDSPELRIFRSHKLALYDGALRFVDTELARLMGWLEERGVADDTVLVVASDHGEAFWDHAALERSLHADPRGIGGIGHGHSLFFELTDVPLILHGPGVPAARVGGIVRNLDLMPTLLGLARVAEPPEMQGVDLLPRARTDAAERLPTLPALSSNIAYGPEAKSIQRGPLKLVRYSDTQQGPKELLFDRSEDPGELRDLREERPADAAALGLELDSMLSGVDGGDALPVEIDPETREALEALGYGR